MKNILNHVLVIVFLFFTTNVYSNPIEKINFIGLNNTTENTLLKEIPLKVGDEYSDSASDTIIQSLFQTGLFSDISVTSNEGNINITLVENPTIKFFVFNIDSGSGFSNWLKGEKLLLSTETLKEELETNKLSSGNPYTQTKLDEFLLLLKSKYSGSGYYNAKISPSISVDAQNRVGIELNINQGERVKIESFSISGSNEIPSERLLKLFKIGEADMAFVNYFTNKDLFTEAEFSQGIDSMTNAYFNLGFLDFKILNVETKLGDKKEKMSLSIQISEGIQYKLGKISFNGGLEVFSREELAGTITTNEGDIFNRSTIIRDIQTLTDKFADKGFAFVDINPVTTDFLNTVNVNFNISLNKKTYINRITISGNTRTQDAVVRREIGIAEGGLYSRSILRKSILNLRRLGYFSDVQISTSEVAGMPDKINIGILVTETQTGSVSFMMSHSNNYGISFGAGIQEKNIFGSGNTLNADFKISESYNKLSFYFMNPNYNEQGHSVSFGAFRSEINDDDVAINSYEINTTGASIGYGIPLSDNTRVNTEFEYTTNEIKCSSLFSSSGYESSQCATKNNDEFMLNINWNKNTLNNYLYPTLGVNNALSARIALPLGDYRYFNLSADHTSYKPVSDTTTLKLTGNFNLSKGFSGKALPFYKRNFGGGSGSVRGFGNKTLGPLYPNGKAKGGEIAILGSANLITPAFFVENNEKMRMSAFIDAGNIFEKSSNIEIGDIRMSAGLGFAYLSPIGSIGAFISTPILKKDGDTIEDFGFSLGTGF
ncbi:MAG: outer membrane protein assembly factor BamA [Pelagibacteraceae bacterium]|jgi:outer membrane protein insertion porin family|nr:outer membrane protein assembly factor BamA [Pelagibacteraceae bacterium]